MKNLFAATFVAVGMIVVSHADAITINLSVDEDRGKFSISASDERGFSFSNHTMGFYGDGAIVNTQVVILGALKNLPDSIVVEQRVDYLYSDPPYLNPPDFTPILWVDMDFTDPTRVCSNWGVCENTYYDPFLGIGYDTEAFDFQLNALYAVAALGDGVPHGSVSVWDEPGEIDYGGGLQVSLDDDKSLNIGMSFPDAGLQAGDIVSVTYRHLFALGIDTVPQNFLAIPEPPGAMLFATGLIALVWTVSGGLGFFANDQARLSKSGN